MSQVHEHIEGRPEPGTAEHARLRMRHEEAVDRVAKLRKMQAQLPEAIADAEALVRDLSGRLGLPPVPREKRTAPGETRRRVLEALPGTARAIAERTGIRRTAVDGALRNLHREGAIEQTEGRTWRRVEASAEGEAA